MVCLYSRSPVKSPQKETAKMLKLLSLLCCCYLAIATPIPRSGRCFQSPLASSSNEFGLKLFNHLGETNKNVFISPFSIYAALSMVHMGARGRTANELETTLELRQHGLYGTYLKESFQKLLYTFHQKQSNYSLLVANSLFLQKDFHVNSTYIEDLHKYYLASLKLVDFARNGTGVKSAVNRWVAENTRNKIPEFLKQPLAPSTVLALFNAVYFNGTWKTPFNKNFTSKGIFIKSNTGINKNVDFMRQYESHYRFFNDSVTQYKFLELPYKGEDIVMLLALPQNDFRPANLLLNASDLCRINASLSKTLLNKVVIPKFHLEYEKELSQNLSRLGIHDLFTSRSNLTGITKSGGVKVSKVQHKAVVDVNEKGSEAAAVTGIHIVTTSIEISPYDFVANHPFLFYIIDKRSGLVLFSGRVADP